MRIEGYINVQHNIDTFQEIFPSFRGLALLLIYYWFIALDVIGWNYFKINYKMYLGFNHHFSTVT